MRLVFTVFVIGQTSAAWAATDFGVRQLPGAALPTDDSGGFGFMRIDKLPGSPAATGGAAQIAEKWGRVTSTFRSPQHNRRVGGVRNSYHLSGRAIDIARRRGVHHAHIASALRAAGYTLIESLDEGDHSHFAFGSRFSAAEFAPQVRAVRAPPKSKGVFALR